MINTVDYLVARTDQVGVYGGELHIAEMTPRFCHYLRFINEAPLLEVADRKKWHHYSRIEGPIKPGVLDEWSSDETGRFHTFSIRKGLRWSDGVPVTTKDVDYAINDVLLLPELRKYLTNSETSEIMMPEWEWITWGKGQIKLHIKDQRTFTLEFAAPFLGFPEMQVRSARWQMLLKPSHYLKRFHYRYADAGELELRKSGDGFAGRSWDAYYNYIDPPIREAGYFVPERIPRIWDYPSLDPWVYLPESKAEHYVLGRNPYYYVCDRWGNQLPYIERITRNFYPSREALTEALGRGESDIAGCFLKVTEKVLAEKPEYNMFHMSLLRPWQVQQAVIIMNLCPQQESLRPYVQDVRFRRAISYALDRHAMRDRIFMGYGQPSQIAPEGFRPYYHPSFASQYVEYDPELAEALLNELGILRGEDGMRSFPEGRKELEMVYYLVTPMAEEVASFFAESLAKIGLQIKLIRLKNGSEMGPYQVRNQHVFSVWEMPGDDPFVTYQIGGLSDPCPLYWRWYETEGEEGVEPIQEVKKLYRLRNQLKNARSPEERYVLAREIYQLQSENLWVLGTVSGVRQPFFSHRRICTGITETESDETIYSVLSDAKVWYIKESE